MAAGDIDDAIDAWHESDSPLALHEYLGISEAEYALWFRDPSALAAIVEGHRGESSGTSPDGAKARVGGRAIKPTIAEGRATRSPGKCALCRRSSTPWSVGCGVSRSASPRVYTGRAVRMVGACVLVPSDLHKDTSMAVDEGPIYTKGHSYRARAEARQRAYRAELLGVPHGRYGHFLSSEAADAGSNFILEESFLAARERQRAGKGVAQRTFDNMLSSQAMCLNLFAPLASRLELATDVLRPFIDGLLEVTAIRIEHTPAADIFNDQTGRGGVDCDVLVEGRTGKGALLQVIETKFVEPEFSGCGFRARGRAAKGQVVCADDVPVRSDRSACLYTGRKRYAYWQRTDEHRLLDAAALEERGCPFGGSRWQLWVNLALAHEEAARRGATDVRFAVCASSMNTALLGGGEVLGGFRALLQAPDAVSLLDLDELLAHVRGSVPAALSGWASGLASRYAGI